MRQKGFTLLEVLVATAIMGIAVVTLLAALSTAMRSAARLTEYDRAALLARRKMDELLVEIRLPRNVVLQGAWDPAVGVDGGWRARLTPFEGPPRGVSGPQILDRLELEVWWMQAGQRRTFQLESYRRGVLRPEDMAFLEPQR